MDDSLQATTAEQVVAFLTSNGEKCFVDTYRYHLEFFRSPLLQGCSADLCDTDEMAMASFTVMTISPLGGGDVLRATHFWVRNGGDPDYLVNFAAQVQTAMDFSSTLSS